MKAYLNYFKLRVLTNLQYRASALAGIFTQLFFGFVYIMVYLALYESNKISNVPMNLNEIITYLWLQQAFFALNYPYTKDKELLDMITNGNLAYELVRPQNFYFKFYIKMISERLTAAMLRSLPIIICALLISSPYKMSAPASLENLIIFVISLLFSCLLVTAFSMIIHVLTIYLLDSRGIVTAYYVLVDLFMGGIVPIPFFPTWLRKIAYALPFRYISDFPYRIYSGSIVLTEGKILLIKSLSWIIVTVCIGFLISKKVLRKAVIQGG